MNILCICEGGNSRSVGLAQMLKVVYYHNAVAVGSMYAFSSENGRQPGFMLCRWADIIVFMADYIAKSTPIPRDCLDKVRLCEVGKDTYNQQGPDQRLWAACKPFVDGGFKDKLPFEPPTA